MGARGNLLQKEGCWWLYLKPSACSLTQERQKLQLVPSSSVVLVMVPGCRGVLQSSQENQFRWDCGVCNNSKLVVTKACPSACRPTPPFPGTHHCFICGSRDGELLAYPGEPAPLMTGAWIVPTLPDTTKIHPAVLGSALAVPALVPPAMGQAVSLGG